MLLVTTWFGSFLLDESKQVRKLLFPNDPQEIAKRMDLVAKGKVLSEEKQLASDLKGFYVLEKRQIALGGELIEEEMPRIDPQDFGFSNTILHEAMMSLAKVAISKEPSPDKSILHAVGAYDDLVQSSNLISERLYEWYGIHFPGQRPLMRDEDLVALILSTRPVDKTQKDDVLPIMELASTLEDMHKRKAQLEEYIKDKMNVTAQNVTHLVGPIVGARLIAKAGGLARLAKLPSGTIQVLGAEKALFRHLKEGANPPKHGYIFQHPLVHRAPYWQRGKIARALASKVAIAAKMDQHSDRVIGEELKKDLMERIQEIKERYPKPKKKGKRR